jgi:predicted acylesterase/phospholipase RssA
VHTRITAALLLFLGALLSACASLERLPALSTEKAREITFHGIPDARFYANDAERVSDFANKMYRRRTAARGTAPITFLALSGGGDDGAFGAGLLAGWSESGSMPVFDVVTGVSTGSLTAPFAFLGREYDAQLKHVYTETEAAEVFQKRNMLAVVADDAMTDSAPLRKMVGDHVDDAMVRRIAEEYRKGRLLLILTTNLDQGRPVIWNIGAIADSDDPKKRELIIQILVASSAIPGVFSPVMLDVTVDGQNFQEMHVDGGTVAQAFLYPPVHSLRRASAKMASAERQARLSRKRIAYIVRNGRLTRSENTVKLQTLAIAKEALSTMITSSGVNDTFRMYLTTQRDRVDFNLASIGSDFEVPYKGPFDTGYMRALYAYGYEQGRTGPKWQKVPPGYLANE